MSILHFIDWLGADKAEETFFSLFSSFVALSDSYTCSAYLCAPPYDGHC